MVPTLIVVGIALVVFWIYEFVLLMLMSDDRFPGRFDKPIWAAILLIGFVPGAVVFFLWQMCDLSGRDTNAIAGRLTDVIQKSSSSEDAT